MLGLHALWLRWHGASCGAASGSAGGAHGGASQLRQRHPGDGGDGRVGAGSVRDRQGARALGSLVGVEDVGHQVPGHLHVPLLHRRTEPHLSRRAGQPDHRLQRPHLRPAAIDEPFPVVALGKGSPSA